MFFLDIELVGGVNTEPCLLSVVEVKAEMATTVFVYSYLIVIFSAYRILLSDYNSQVGSVLKKL